MGENHWMLVGGVAVPAIEIAAGTVLSRQLGNADPAVSAVTRSMSPGRWALSTRSCKVYANGILTGTLCGNQSSELWTQPLRPGRRGQSPFWHEQCRCSFAEQHSGSGNDLAATVSFERAQHAAWLARNTRL